MDFDPKKRATLRWMVDQGLKAGAAAAVAPSAARMFIGEAEAAAGRHRDISKVSPLVSKRFKGFAFEGFTQRCVENGILPVFTIERAQLIDPRTNENYTFFIPMDKPEKAMLHMRLAYADYGALGDRLIVGKDIDINNVLGSKIDCGDIASEVLDVQTYLMANAGAGKVPALHYVLNSGKRSAAHQQGISQASHGRVGHNSAHIGGFAFDGYMRHITKEQLYSEAKKMGISRGIYPNFCHFDVCEQGRWFGADGAGKYYPATRFAQLEGISLEKATKDGKSDEREDDWFCRNLGVCTGSVSDKKNKARTSGEKTTQAKAEAGFPDPFDMLSR